MIKLIQSVFMMLIGAVLGLYGCIYAVQTIPLAVHLQLLWQALPAIAAVSTFGIAVFAVVCGVLLLVYAVNRFNKQYRQLDQLSHLPMHERDGFMDHPAYR